MDYPTVIYTISIISFVWSYKISQASIIDYNKGQEYRDIKGIQQSSSDVLIPKWY